MKHRIFCLPLVLCLLLCLVFPIAATAPRETLVSIYLSELERLLGIIEAGEIPQNPDGSALYGSRAALEAFSADMRALSLPMPKNGVTFDTAAIAFIADGDTLTGYKLLYRSETVNAQFDFFPHGDQTITLPTDREPIGQTRVCGQTLSLYEAVGGSYLIGWYEQDGMRMQFTVDPVEVDLTSLDLFTHTGSNEPHTLSLDPVRIPALVSSLRGGEIPADGAAFFADEATVTAFCADMERIEFPVLLDRNRASTADFTVTRVADGLHYDLRWEIMGVLYQFQYLGEDSLSADPHPTSLSVAIGEETCFLVGSNDGTEDGCLIGKLGPDPIWVTVSNIGISASAFDDFALSPLATYFPEEADVQEEGCFGAIAGLPLFSLCVLPFALRRRA